MLNIWYSHMVFLWRNAVIFLFTGSFPNMSGGKRVKESELWCSETSLSLYPLSTHSQSWDWWCQELSLSALPLPNSTSLVNRKGKVQPYVFLIKFHSYSYKTSCFWKVHEVNSTVTQRSRSEIRTCLKMPEVNVMYCWKLPTAIEVK